MGDCRALLIRSSTHPTPYVQLTVDQRATEPSERSRVIKAGGQIEDGRVWGALMPSRTLGDFPWKDRGPGVEQSPIPSLSPTSVESPALPIPPSFHTARIRLAPDVAPQDSWPRLR